MNCLKKKKQEIQKKEENVFIRAWSLLSSNLYNSLIELFKALYYIANKIDCLHSGEEHYTIYISDRYIFFFKHKKFIVCVHSSWISCLWGNRTSLNYISCNFSASQGRSKAMRDNTQTSNLDHLSVIQAKLN